MSKNLINISIKKETHEMLVTHVEKFGGKIGKWADMVLTERLEKENKKGTKKSQSNP
jgi:hypothetical protein